MGLHASARARLSALAFLVAMAAGCGGGAGGGADPIDPPAPPAPPPAPSVFLEFGVHPAASVVIGHSVFDEGDFVDDGTTFRLESPEGNPGVTVDGTLLVEAAGAEELKFFANYDALNAPEPALAVGIPGLTASMAGEKLVLFGSQGFNVFNVADVRAGGQLPDVSLVSGGTDTPGCSRFQTNSPRAAVITAQGHLIVADTGNNRVLIWHTLPASGNVGEPQVVLGQHDLDTCIANDDDFNTEPDGNPTARTLNTPAAVWSDGTKLVVVDQGNSRVLIWNTIPASGQHFKPADHVLGQPNAVTGTPNSGAAASVLTLNEPSAVDVSDKGQMAVVDTNNHRVLLWDAVPTSSSVAARQVIGQADFAHTQANDEDQNGTIDVPSAKTLRNPSGVRFHNRNLIVTDTGNNRVLVYRALD